MRIFRPIFIDNETMLSGGTYLLVYVVMAVLYQKVRQIGKFFFCSNIKKEIIALSNSILTTPATWDIVCIFTQKIHTRHQYDFQ